MKKLSILFCLVLLVFTNTYGQTSASVLLQHEGNVTTYLPEQIQDAFDDAEHGDMIFLSEGKFIGFDITKRVSVRGAGENTIVVGDININIEDDEVPMEVPILQSLVINGSSSGSIYVKHAMKRLELLKIKHQTYNRSTLVFEADVNNLVVDRCYVLSLYISKQVKNALIKNTYANSLSSGAQYGNCSISIINCTINQIGTDSNIESPTLGNVLNSIVKPGLYPRNTVFSYCLTHLNESSVEYLKIFQTSFQNCYNLDIPSGTLPTTTEELLENGYLGMDGTVVGTAGGETPYVGIEPVAPKVTKSELHIDQANKKLNVKLNMQP